MNEIERIAKALESIAASMERIANPAVTFVGPQRQRRACPVEDDGFCPNYCGTDEACKLARHLPRWTFPHEWHAYEPPAEHFTNSRNYRGIGDSDTYRSSTDDLLQRRWSR